MFSRKARLPPVLSQDAKVVIHPGSVPETAGLKMLCRGFDTPRAVFPHFGGITCPWWLSLPRTPRDRGLQLSTHLIKSFHSWMDYLINSYRVAGRSSLYYEWCTTLR